jgi:transposase-like protein
MKPKRAGTNVGIRYSEAFKMLVVREVEEGDLPFAQVARKYGIKSQTTVRRWVCKYGNGSRGKVIRVERPGEIDEKKQLKNRIRQLERALADSNIDAALERAYTRIALRRAGIEDVEEFKKKAAVQLREKL